MDRQVMVSALPSWRPGSARDAIVDVLIEVTQGRRAVPAPERVAAFDNDGTLACEKPHTALASFLAAEAATRGDPIPDGLDGHAVLRAMGALFEGSSTVEYEEHAAAFLDQARHPRFGCQYPDLVYAPMRELIGLLQDLQFGVFLCSDSSRDFNRVWAGPAYGLSRERVIGSEVRIELRDGRLVRTADSGLLDDGPGKPVHLWDRIGQLPLLAAGNAAGDVEMLSCARFGLLVSHDDADREYAYPDPALLATAARGGWTVVSMREDFDRVWVSDAAGPGR
jgi:hypothetical protein